jgi:hypothetical protein
MKRKVFSQEFYLFLGKTLLFKFENSLNRFEDNDYKLKYTKTNENKDLSKYKCNWFKCGNSFATESSLSQHMKTTHFAVNDYYDSDYDFISSKPKTETRILIECGQEYNENKSRSVREKPFVCDWVGCELRFRFQYELNRHQKSIHYCEKQYSMSSNKRSFDSGLKPLKIYNFSNGFDASEMVYKCDHCEKRYTRLDRLKTHINSTHSSGNY